MRMLIGLAHHCIRVLAATEENVETSFKAIIEKLEKRHKTSMRPESIEKLTVIKIDS